MPSEKVTRTCAEASDGGVDATDAAETIRKWRWVSSLSRACRARLTSEGLNEEMFLTSSEMLCVVPTAAAILSAKACTALVQAAGISVADCAKAGADNDAATRRNAGSIARSREEIRQRSRIGLSRVKIISIDNHLSTPGNFEMAQGRCVFTTRKLVFQPRWTNRRRCRRLGGFACPAPVLESRTGQRHPQGVLPALLPLPATQRRLARATGKPAREFLAFNCCA